MTPEQAELNFLDNVRKLPMYGVHRHLALVSSVLYLRVKGGDPSTEHFLCTLYDAMELIWQPACLSLGKCQMFSFLQDVNCEKVFIGVSNVGVTIYRGNRLMSTFVW